MAFLNNMNLDEVDETATDFTVPNGVYPATVGDSKIIGSEKGDLWQITYRISPDIEDFGGRAVSEFFNLDPALPDTRKAWLKRRLISLGIGAEESKTMDPGDIIGVDVTITVKNKKSGEKVYTNVTGVVLGSDLPASAGALANF